MSDTMEIIISAVDQASNVFHSIVSSVTSMGSSIESVVGITSSEFDNMSNNVSGFQNAINSIDDTTIQELADDLGLSTEEVERLIEAGADIGSIPFDDAAAAAEELGDGADKAENDVEQLGDEARSTGDELDNLSNTSVSSGATIQMAFSNIADGLTRAKEGVVELGHNILETLDLAGQQQQQQAFLEMSIGAEKTAQQMGIINQLVADLPGDDVAIGGLLSQATAKNASITADELKRMGTNAADYFAAMSNYGKSSVEAQQDLVNYILAGNTAELERSPVLQGHIDKLKQAGTVEERNKALQEALTEEGWAGISQQDTYNNKLETFTAMLDRGKRQMGEMFLEAASGAMDFLGQLDASTGGIVAMGIAFATVVGGPMVSLLTGLGQMATGINALSTAYKELSITESIVNAVEGEGVVARIASALGITSEAAAAEGATVAFGGLAVAEGAALWPVLAIAAAVAALVVVIYEVGKAFGWWTDVGTMLTAIWTGVNRLWNAFINHPDVQAAIHAISSALGKLWDAIQKAGQEVLKFFGISAGSNWDIVRSVIDGIGWAWNGLKSILGPIIGIVLQVWNAFNDLMASIGPLGDILILLFVPGGLIIEMFRLLTDVLNGNTERWGWLGTVLGVVVGILQWVYNGIVWLIGGLTQLWNTFSQSSQVQGTLSWLVNSWNWLVNAVNGAIQAVFDFFGAISGTNLGEATNLLEGLMLIWENLQEPIRMVTQFVTDLGTAIYNVLTGQQDLGSAMTDVWNSLLTNIVPLLQAAGQIITNFALQASLWAMQAGRDFVLNIINYLRTLPGQVMNWINQTGTNVNTGMQRWITTAISKASSMVSNILSYIRTLPSRILALLLQVLASIRSAGSQWVSTARSKASQLVNSAASTIAQLPGRVRSALAGLVNAIVGPFRDAYNTAKGWWDKIKNLSDGLGKGGYDLPASQEIDLFGNWGADYYTTSENTVTVKGGADLNINLTGLPNTVDEETVAEIVLQSIQSDSTIERLVSNPLFQTVDAKMKGKTQRRVNRSRGV